MSSGKKEYTCRLRIGNPLGFHVRPVQRFAELAQIFESDITVEIDGRQASGKSVMGLMSLGGRCGAKMKITTSGEDARQARDVIKYLVREDFFVEDDIEADKRPRRHIARLKKFASCFDSDIKLVLEGRKIKISLPGDFDALEFSPTDDIAFIVEGADALQARKVLEKLANYSFYREDVMDATTE